MRLLLTTDAVGGVWTFTRELTCELLERGHAVGLLSLGREPSPGQKQWAAETADTFGQRFLLCSSPAPLEWMDTNARAWSEGAAALHDMLRVFPADLIHSSQFCFGALEAGLPTVVTAHSDVLSWAEACRPGGLEESAWLNRYLQLVRRGLAAADAVVAPSQWMASTLERLYDPPSTVLVIPNGRTLTPFDPESDRDAVRMFQAVAAGRLWDEAKGLRTLLERQYPLPLRIAGDLTLGSADAAPPTLPKGTELLGPLSETTLLALFRDSAVYLATSFYEPFGYAPLEAALCGCAVITRDLPSFREVWGEGALYFLTEHDLEEVLTAIRKSETYFTAARHRSTERARLYTAGRMADGYEALYRSVLRTREHAGAAPLPVPSPVREERGASRG